MKKDVKVIDAETELLAEKMAIVVIYFVTLILAALTSQKFGFSSNYIPLISLLTTVLAITAYLYQLKKNKKAEAA